MAKYIIASILVFVVSIGFHAYVNDAQPKAEMTLSAR